MLTLRLPDDHMEDRELLRFRTASHLNLRVAVGSDGDMGESHRIGQAAEAAGNGRVGCDGEGEYH